MTDISEETRQKARDNMDKYRAKRALIRAIENLDCITDADLINAIARAVPDRPRRS